MDEANVRWLRDVADCIDNRQGFPLASHDAVRLREIADSHAALVEACEAALDELYGYADSGGSVKASHICDQLRAALSSPKER